MGMSEAINKKTFSVLDAAKGRSYPTDDVTVYTDVESIYLFLSMNQAANEAETGEIANEIDEAVTDLREKILASALTFHMRGFSPGVRKSINDEARAKFPVEDDAELDQGEPYVWRLNKYIAESIIRVTNAEGAVDEHRWSVEDVAQIRAILTDEDSVKIEAMMLQLSMGAWQFDAAVSADFS